MRCWQRIRPGLSLTVRGRGMWVVTVCVQGEPGSWGSGTRYRKAQVDAEYYPPGRNERRVRRWWLVQSGLEVFNQGESPLPPYRNLREAAEGVEVYLRAVEAAGRLRGNTED